MGSRAISGESRISMADPLGSAAESLDLDVAAKATDKSQLYIVNAELLISSRVDE